MARVLPRACHPLSVLGVACRVSCATTSAISIAATAASHPLLPVPSPARASASSTELVVSTPNAIGTPVAAAAVGQAVRHRRRDVLEVRRLAANQAAEADDRVEAPALGGVLRRQRNLEGARHADDRDVARRDAGRGQRRERAGLQPVGDEVVVLRHDEREAEARPPPASLRSSAIDGAAGAITVP